MACLPGGAGIWFDARLKRLSIPGLAGAYRRGMGSPLALVSDLALTPARVYDGTLITLGLVSSLCCCIPGGSVDPRLPLLDYLRPHPRRFQDHQKVARGPGLGCHNAGVPFAGFRGLLCVAEPGGRISPFFWL